MRPYVRAANVTWDGLDLSNVKRMNFTESESAIYELAPGDVLVAEASGSASEVGKAAIWRGEIEDCCFQNTIIRVRSYGVAPEYLRYFLLNEASSGRIGNASPGVGIHHIGSRRLAEWPVPVPPLNEQRRIVAAIEELLSRLDAADASLAAALRRLDGLVRPIRERAIEVGSESELGELLTDIEAGKSFKCHSRRADSDEWGVIKVSAMTWGLFREDENKAVLSEERVDSRWEIRPGDLLLSRANTTEHVGASVLVADCRPRLLLSDKSMRLIVNGDVHKPWLLYALRAPSVRSQMSAVATGTSDSMRNISQSKVRAVRLRVPPLEEQRRIVAEVEEQLSVIDAMRASIERAQRRSATLRAAILERAFHGELVPQDPSDEPAEALLARIRAGRESAPAPLRRGGKGE